MPLPLLWALMAIFSVRALGADASSSESVSPNGTDRVTLRQADGQTQTITGEIERITGAGGVTLLAADGTKTSFPMSRLLDLEIVRNQPHTEAEALFAETFDAGASLAGASLAGEESGASEKLVEALALFRQARSEEKRYWVQQLLTARIAATLFALGERGRASEEFFLLCQTDPFTPYLSSIPLEWTDRPPDLSGVTTDAKTLAAWLDDSANPTGRINPAGKLLAATLLLSGPLRTQARAALDSLVTLRSPLPDNADVTEHCRAVALLATAQIWRLKLAAGPKPEEVKIWRQALDRFPPTLAAGPSLVVALALERIGESDARSSDDVPPGQ